MLKLKAPRRHAHGQALAKLEARDGEQVDADDPRIDEMLQAPVRDVEVRQMHYGHDFVVERAAVVENEAGIRWMLPMRILNEDVPDHVREAAREALDVED